MDAANGVRHVKGQSSALAVVEPDLKVGLRFRLVDGGLAVRGVFVDSASETGRSAEADTTARKSHSLSLLIVLVFGTSCPPFSFFVIFDAAQHPLIG